MATIDFTALICSRLCHDLVSPVGAFTNGIEIFNDEKDPAIREQVMELLATSADQTTRKLKFFRMAFGASGDLKSKMDLQEAGTALTNYLLDDEIAVNWTMGVDRVRKDIAKLLLNLSLVASESLIRGGSITVEMDAKSRGYDIRIVVEGNRIIMREEVVAALTSDVAEGDLSPRTAPAQMVHEIAHECGGAITIDEGFEGRVVFTTALSED